MSESTRFFTPSTGLPDLEAKIAYGLAAVGMECTDKVYVRPGPQCYEVEVGASIDQMASAFAILLGRVLSSTRLFSGVPGVQPKYVSKYPFSGESGEITQLARSALGQLTSYRRPAPMDYKTAPVCGHSDIPCFGSTSSERSRIGGLLLALSVHAGMPSARDAAIRHANLGICRFCGYLAFLGLTRFTVRFQLQGKGELFFLPVPTQTLTPEALATLASTQKILNRQRTRADLPGELSVLALLGEHPSTADMLLEAGGKAHIACVVSSGKAHRIAWVYSGNANPLARFVADNSHNCCHIEDLLGDYVGRRQPEAAVLRELKVALEERSCTAAARFVRRYKAAMEHIGRHRLIHHKTCQYLLSEVCMIPKEIITNPSIRAVARLVRDFVEENIYGYADEFRNARWGSRDFEETLVRLLRQAKTERSNQENKEEQTHKFFPPSEAEVVEVIKLASRDEETFQQVKLAIAILAFCRPSKSIDKSSEGGE